MAGKKTETFGKSKYCPATEELLAFTKDELTKSEMKQIAAHLEECEFCCAERYFLIVHPPLENCVQISAEMPCQLRQLAEILLGDKKREFQMLKRLFQEIKPQSESKAHSVT